MRRDFIKQCRYYYGLINNSISPNPVKNKDLAKELDKVLHRPSFFPAPGFMVKLVLGELGSIILEGQRVTPQSIVEK